MPLGAGGKIYDVKARCKYSDVLKIRKLCYYFLGECSLVGDADICAFCALCQLLGRGHIVDGKVSELLYRCPGYIPGVCCGTVKYNYLHVFPSQGYCFI